MRIVSPSVSPVEHHAQARLASFSIDEDLIGIGGLVANHGRSRHEDRVLAARQQHARRGEHAGPQLRFRIIEARFENEDARIGVDRGIDGRSLCPGSRGPG